MSDFYFKLVDLACNDPEMNSNFQVVGVATTVNHFGNNCMGLIVEKYHWNKYEDGLVLFVISVSGLAFRQLVS